MDIISLFEARRNPEVNTGLRHKNVLEQIEPYFGREDVFISMVEVPKLGIHPSTGHHGTPTGIYAYQLSSPEVCNQFIDNRMPYMSWAKYVSLLVAKPDIVWLSSDTPEAELAPRQEMLDDLMGKVVDPEIWARTKREAIKRNPWRAEHAASFFYNDIWLGAAIMTARQRSPEGFRAGPKIDYLINHMFNDNNKARPHFWNSLLRRLGYDGVIDHGTKMIYNLEPHQACFLHRGAIQNFELFRNGRSGVYEHGKTIASASHLIKAISNREMSTANCLNFLDAILERRPPGIAGDDCAYNTYDHDIRLTHSQIRRMVKYMFDHDPEGTQHAMGRERIFNTMLWKVAGDIVGDQ